jgi:hypothetical protein
MMGQVCNVCHEPFTSRTKLFDHIKVVSFFCSIGSYSKLAQGYWPCASFSRTRSREGSQGQRQALISLGRVATFRSLLSEVLQSLF